MPRPMVCVVELELLLELDEALLVELVVLLELLLVLPGLLLLDVFFVSLIKVCGFNPKPLSASNSAGPANNCTCTPWLTAILSACPPWTGYELALPSKSSAPLILMAR